MKFHLRPARNNYASSSVTSEGNSLKTTELHFLAFLKLFALSYLQMPMYSPRVAPCLTVASGTLFSLHSALINFL